MFRLMRRAWRYMTAAATGKFEEHADPKVQLTQAIAESRERHTTTVEQAANVIANQRQTEMRLNRALEELGRLKASTRQAVLMTDEASKQGDALKVTDYSQAAEAFAGRLIEAEHEVGSLKEMLLQSTQAADQAKSAVKQSSQLIRRKLTEQQRLLSQLDQAKMQEQLNKAMSSLSESVGQDIPSFDEIRLKVEARYAKALGSSEIASLSVERRILEIEQTQMDLEAQGRLSQIRAELGIGSALGPSVTPAVEGAS